MYIPKRYGQSKIERCPFCQAQATAKNSQGLNVCTRHKESILPNIKCMCGSHLELRTGKWGPYFFCINCGNINLKKGLEMIGVKKNVQEKSEVNKRDGKDAFMKDPGKYPGFDYGIE